MGENQNTGPSNLTDKASEVGQNLRDLGGQFADQAREKYEQFSGQAREYYDQGREMAKQWEQGLESYVQEKPIQSLLIAGVVGMLLGILWKRS